MQCSSSLQSVFAVLAGKTVLTLKFESYYANTYLLFHFTLIYIIMCVYMIANSGFY